MTRARALEVLDDIIREFELLPPDPSDGDDEDLEALEMARAALKAAAGSGRDQMTLVTCPPDWMRTHH